LAVIAPLVGIYFVLVALLVGSFINLAADRAPRGESLVRPRSHCRSCGRQLNLVDLLPVVGYLLRRGKCASCRASIGIGSPIVEAVAGGLMVLAIVWLGVWPGGLVGLALIGLWGGIVVATAVRAKRSDDRAQAP
jgi:leader peptidase (prepilin peptidase)/N-methyltransferase